MNTSFSPSPLMLGTVQFGMRYGIANTTGQPSFDEVKSMLKYAYEHGVTALDTSSDYGNSEEVIGKALDELGLLGRFMVVTKVSLPPEGQQPVDFYEASLRESCRRLCLDSIPVALLHNEKALPLLPMLEAMVAKGLIGGAGISLDSAAYADKADHVAYLQVPCNVADHRFDRVFTIPRKQTFVRSVYLQGMLVMPKENIKIPELRAARETLEEFGLPMQELCMRYLFSLPGSPRILTGVERLEQLKENIRLASLGPLPKDLFASVASAVRLEEKFVRPSMWGKLRS
ncbi:MAG: aldo/keto reductase [Victivallales bacterium]|nr:aldo/keto reductase [Victivallales bacterium]